MALRHTVSSVPRSTTSTDADLLIKRRRLGLPDSTPSTNSFGASNPGSPTTTTTTTRTDGSQTTISNIVLRKWSGKDEKKKEFFKPRYCPGDRDELLKRLVSFQELTDWTPKPDLVNEVQWAKRGWICNGKERVRCTLCNKELVVRLNKKSADGKEVMVLVPSEIEDALVQKYVELIVTSHQEDCLWRKRGCDDSLLRLPLSNRQNAIQDLRKRYDELCARNAFLPYEFNLRLPEGLSINAILSQLPPDFFSAPPPPPTSPSPSSPNRVALALAVLGWQGLDNPRIGPVPNTASCHTCLRRLGLWMFKSKEIDPETNEVLVPAPMDHLDPTREHRFFCPWKSAEAQRISPDAGSQRRMRLAADEGDKAGWQVLLQVLKNEAYLRDRETPSKRASGAGREKPPQTHRRSVMGESGGQGSPYASTPGLEGSAIVGDGPEDQEDEKVEAEKDKERWARLRRVKSMLSSKGARKLRKSFSASRPGSALSRPGTSHSTAHDGETPQAETQQSAAAPVDQAR
ncbi:zf-C3HC-domain-containing protein [Cryphonectria parasitica EP155]|uniref:Zf-C3HC-domain-containing protein n=1 Tax=Cryphonectria parasitica (strain ATCC 38755 / EP155) TaxID=660469 RepID=A0A9P4XV02_CRYP1|nr:zf-C3HC-domain-containing protein [Cryphonectria parasitica EP155]KAF3761488.1 zf-C3HC-domain-containing protein [Cryphonectria parasitica EP155]